MLAILAAVSLLFVLTYPAIMRHSVSMNLSDINLYSLFFYYYGLIWVLPGTFLIGLGLVEFSPYVRLTTVETRSLALFSISLSYTLFAVYSLVLFGALKAPNIKGMRQAIYRANKRRAKRLVGFLVALSIVLVSYSAFHIIEDLPILYALAGDIEEANVARIRVRAEFSGVVFIYNIMTPIFVPLTVISLYLYKLVYGGKAVSILFWIVFVLAAMYLVHDMRKGALPALMLALLIARMFVLGFSYKYVVMGFVVVGLAFVFYGAGKTFGFDDFGYLVYRFINRVFLSQAGGAFLSIEWFPDQIAHVPLQGIPTVITEVFGLPRYNSAREVMLLLEGDGAHLGVKNSHYIGGAWASYGFLGFIISPLVVAYSVYLFQMIAEAMVARYGVVGLAYYFWFALQFNPTADYRYYAYFIVLAVPLVVGMILFFADRAMGTRRKAW